MEDRLTKYINRNTLFNNDQKILVALSGGIDSVVLLDLLFKTGFSISIAHCNFHLRGDESNQDEKFVRNLGIKYNLTTFVNNCNAAEYAKNNKISIQESARELRYDWFEKLLMEHDLNKVAVAHHFDDNLETFFINFSRASGLTGLKGIPIKNNNIVRPLMFANRNEIEEYCQKNNLQYRNDSSNASLKYLRNKLRHQLIPKFTEIIGGSTKTLQKSMDFLIEDNLVFDQLLNEKRRLLEKKDENSIYFLRKDLINLHPIETWLFYLLKPYNFTRFVSNEISNALKEENSGKKFYSKSHWLFTKNEKIIISELDNDKNEISYLINKDTVILSDPINLEFFKITNSKDFKIEKKNNIAFFDSDKLTFPLELRKWKKGDRFKPFGMKGSKLLSDYFIDQKLNLLEKENIWIITSNEEIIWVVGMRTSDKFKITKQTSNILKISNI